ncbi:hypothetical protein [Ulvibacterium marinum]|uniref:Uncharacterized protein n=1 Tax=Ulvibacterium marinum TaxID=2419782 RepID=A0A3B0C5N6_9FLAO|nr:hypothetical protein [Ulvibacterium marinum]RKN81393.1 hypothetical protein D7Z94_10715 [Ulvibacterium marinum]
MSRSERDYIELCKKQLEEKFSFGNGQGYSQKDLELLSNYIEEEKGLYISLSTLKRLWKNSFKQGPQLATLNALAKTLNYENWQDFKLKNKDDKVVHANTPLNSNQGHGSVSSKLRKPGAAFLFALLIIVLILFVYGPKENTSVLKGSISINGPVVFKADKTLSRGVPNTFVFNYDVSQVQADSFFVQQTWNDKKKERIDPRGTVFTSIYYESGFHRARLIANDSVIAMQPVHILSDGWEPHVYYDSSDERFVDFKGESFITEGRFHLPKDLLLKKNVDTSQYFITRIGHSKAYEVSSDNFEFNVRTKLDTMNNSNCPWLNVLIVTEKNAFNIELVQKGCEAYASYHIGEIRRNGKVNDLSLLGRNIFEWQELNLSVKEKNAEIRINGESSYFETFKEDFGKVMGLIFIFEGKGSIDHVKLSDTTGTISFEDNFEK